MLLELEQTISPLSKRDKVQLLHFLIDELASMNDELSAEERYNTNCL